MKKARTSAQIAGGLMKGNEKMKKRFRYIAVLLALILSFVLSGCAGGNSAGELSEQTKQAGSRQEIQVEESGEYTSRDEVAAYLYTYGHLPGNYITKKEAKALGWVSKEGNLKEVAPGKSIGGDYFGNYEGSLPEESGRDYFECDIDGDGGYRGAKRIIYSNDGLIYYTEDHYESFELLYGEE